jgi:post-segregation antitoxin (ccd killing protein)
MQAVRVTIRLPAELVERARAVDINISHACRAGLEARLASETVSPSELASRVAWLEYRVGKLLDCRNKVKG